LFARSGSGPERLNYGAFYEKPLRKFERLLETYLAFAPRGFVSFRAALPVWLKDKLYHRRMLKAGIPQATQARLVFTDHHESHAASAFFPSPFERAAILTIDGVGEWSTTTIGIGESHGIRLLKHLRFPHSLGLLYSAFTYYCGFRVNSGEYKLMGLAPYGKPLFADVILQRLMTLRDDGSFRLNLDFFDYCHGLHMTSRRFHDLFGGPPRSPESPLEQRHLDLASSIQRVTEECVLRLGRYVHSQTDCTDLVLAGGVALNCVANGRLSREGPFRRLWIQPAAGDAGGALGAALFTWHQLLERPRVIEKPDAQQGSLLGPQFEDNQIRQDLDAAGAVYEHLDDEAALLLTIAHCLANGKIVGWFDGRMEFGPRALGARSILADPRHSRMQSILNLKIKFRESFRPFAPAVLLEHANDWFGLQPGEESPYMLLTAPVIESRRMTPSEEELQTMESSPDLCERVNVVRSSIPAVTHVDYSARVQTVDARRNQRFYRLLQAFHQLTGCPVLANTSFNVRGEPIVCTPGDAWRCFRATEMDVLVVGSFVMDKQRQSDTLDANQRQAHLARFERD